MNKQSKICPICSQCCLINNLNCNIIWKCTCGYKESITNEDYSYIIDKQTSTNEPPYFSSKGNSLQKSNPLLKNKRKRNDTIELNQKENKSNCININDIEIIKTINSYNNVIKSLLLLNDKRISSCSNNKSIMIFDPYDDYQHAQLLNRHSNNSICLLEDDTIVSCSVERTIYIGDYTIPSAHDEAINKVIALPNNRIATCSDDQTIKIWKSNKPYSDTPIKVLEGHSDKVDSLLYIKERDIMISGSVDGTLLLWNISNYQCDKTIIGVYCCWTNALYQIDNDRVIVGAENGFFIVNIDKCVVEKTIEDESLGFVNCFLKLRDNNTILCGCESGQLCYYYLITEKYSISKNNHEEDINDLLLVNDKSFLSCSEDSVIKLWNY